MRGLCYFVNRKIQDVGKSMSFMRQDEETKEFTCVYVYLVSYARA